MKLSQIIKELDLKKCTPVKEPDAEVVSGYCGDLLSDVMANCPEKAVWLTMQVHQNITAVATMKEVTAVILVNGREPQPETLQKAQAEKIAILSSTLPSFELAGRLCKMGLKGSTK